MRPWLLLLLLVGCGATGSALPDDVPDPDLVEIESRGDFVYYLDRACLSDDDLDALHEDLTVARRFLVEWLGPGMAPGDFRPRGTPRDTCPPDWEFGVAPELGPVDVVVLASGGRCHADGDGIAVVRSHVARGDATHELVHYVAGSSWHPIDEGFAVYLTERIVGPDEDCPILSRARVYHDLNLITYLTPRELGETMNRRDYDVGGAFVGWLIDSFGKPSFLQLYAGAERDYMTVYGIGERELVERFWAHVGDAQIHQDSGYYAFKALLEQRQ